MKWFLCEECGKFYREEVAEEMGMKCCGESSIKPDNGEPEPLCKKDFENIDYDVDFENIDYDEDFEDCEDDEDFEDYEDDEDDYDYRAMAREEKARNDRISKGLPLHSSGCSCATETDEWNGWECAVSGGACIYAYPSSKACARDYGEGPDAYDEDGNFISFEDEIEKGLDDSEDIDLEDSIEIDF